MRFLLVPLVALLVVGAEGARILAVMPMPARSHLIAFTAVTKALALKGHDVTFISANPIKDMPPNHKTIPVGNPFVEQMNETLSSFFTKPMSPLVGVSFLWHWGEVMTNATFSNPLFQAEMKSGAKYDLVLVEAFFCQEAFVALGHKFNVPVVSINPFGTSLTINDIAGNPVNPAWVPNPFLGYSDHMSLYERTINTVFTLFHYAGYYLYHLPKQQGVVSRFLPDAPPLQELLRTRLALTLVNNHYTLFYPAPMAPNVVEVGGLQLKNEPKPLPKELKDYMDDAKDGVVYFSMGSNLKLQYLPQEKSEAILGALGALKQKVILKWDGPSPKVAPNIKIVDWVPQADLLAHPNLRVFVSHGGLLSTQEAVFNGVPLVGIPVFGDQHFNMKLAVSKGFCVKVDLGTISQQTLSEALKEVLGNPQYAKAVKYFSTRFRAKPQLPLDTALFWIEHVLQFGGEHLRPSSVDLAWYQVLLLDVALILVSPIVLFALCCRWLCCKKRAPAQSHAQSSKSKKSN